MSTFWGKTAFGYSVCCELYTDSDTMTGADARFRKCVCVGGGGGEVHFRAPQKGKIGLDPQDASPLIRPCFSGCFIRPHVVSQI